MGNTGGKLTEGSHFFGINELNLRIFQFVHRGTEVLIGFQQFFRSRIYFLFEQGILIDNEFFVLL